MRTDFYFNNNNILGSNIAKVFFYENGVILGEIEDIEEHNIVNEKLTSVYDGKPESVFVDCDLKKALKLNLERKDCFYMKNPEIKYSFDPAYVLYINASFVDFDKVGDLLAFEANNEKCFLECYNVTFKKAFFTRCIVEREFCENYTLKPGERFGDHYGTNKEHAIIKPFDLSNEYSLYVKKHPERAGEKGILRKYIKPETLENHRILVNKRCYSKVIKNEFRLNAERIAEKFTECGFKASYYDVEKLLNSGIKIEF